MKSEYKNKDILIEKLFTASPKCYNCAQMVLVSMREEFAINDSTIAEYSKFGGGRAKDNCCGGLYAAKQLVKDDSIKEQFITNRFQEIIGSTRCKDIRDNSMINCRRAVKTAVRLINIE